MYRRESVSEWLRKREHDPGTERLTGRRARSAGGRLLPMSVKRCAADTSSEVITRKSGAEPNLPTPLGRFVNTMSAVGHD
jgi:hypothetical protein